MKLSKEQIEQVAVGVVQVVKNGNFVRCLRFTDEQIKMYAEHKDGCFFNKTNCSAGVKLAFKTNSEHLSIKGMATKSGPRNYYAIDLLVNDEFADCISNFSDSMQGDFTERDFPLGNFEKTFELGVGEKKVELYLPFTVYVDFEEISLDDGAFIEPVKAKRKGLLFGDSITQGYDCLYPSKHHTAILSKFLDTDFVNKAIGGEFYNPRLAKLKDDIKPDYILVAYGTNDWSNAFTLENFTKNCKEFFQFVRQNYPKAKIFALAPIWRKDYKDRQVQFDFMMIAKAIKQVVTEIENVVFIDGFDFIPHSAEFFADSYLHPNDKGFKHYAENLCKAIKGKIN